MTLKTRRILFYSFVFLFVLAAVVIVLYSGGFRFDFQTGTVSKTGGIYIKSKPSNIDITLDGKRVKNDSGIFQSGTLITDLLPGVYSIELSGDNYYPWKKNAAVDAGGVSVFDNIILLSKDKGEQIASSTDYFYVSGNKILSVDDGEIEFDGTVVIGDEIVEFTPGGTVITLNKKSGNYYLSNIFDLDSSLNINAVFNNLKQTRLDLPGAVPLRKVVPYPYNDRKFIVMTGRALYALDTERLTIEQISPNVTDFMVSGNDVLWTGEDGLSSFNMVFRSKSQIPLPENIDINTIGSFGLSPSGKEIAILTKNGDLIILDRGTTSSTNISNSATSFFFSPDGSTIAFIENRVNLYAYYLSNQDVKNEVLVELATLPNPENITWHRKNDYLFLTDSSNNLHFVEVNDTKPINNYVISQNVKSFIYDGEEEILYFDDGTAIRRMTI